MIIRSTLFAFSLLATSAASAAVLQPHLAPPATAPDAPTKEKQVRDKDGDVLRGPKVPQKGIESDRPFTGGKGGKDGQRPAAQMGSKPAIEQGAFFTAIDSMGFEGDLGKSIDGARAEFLERVKQWEATSGEQRKKLFESRKQASPSEPPSEEFKKKMAEIEASRPKLAELQQRVYGMLSEEQGAKLKDAYDAELKRVRDEIARKAEAERKRREAEKGKKPAPEGKGKPADGAPRKGGDRPAPPAKPAGDKPAAPGA